MHCNILQWSKALQAGNAFSSGESPPLPTAAMEIQCIIGRTRAAYLDVDVGKMES